MRMLGAELKVWEQRSATAEPPQPIDSGETQRREAFAPSKKPGVTSYTSATVAQEIVRCVCAGLSWVDERVADV